MHICCRLSQNKRVSIISVFWVMSFLLLVIVLPISVSAVPLDKSAVIRASDENVYEIQYTNPLNPKYFWINSLDDVTPSHDVVAELYIAARILNRPITVWDIYEEADELQEWVDSETVHSSNLKRFHWLATTVGSVSASFLSGAISGAVDITTSLISDEGLQKLIHAVIGASTLINEERVMAQAYFITSAYARAAKLYRVVYEEMLSSAENGIEIDIETIKFGYESLIKGSIYVQYVHWMMNEYIILPDRWDRLWNFALAVFPITSLGHFFASQGESVEDLRQMNHLFDDSDEQITQQTIPVVNAEFGDNSKANAISALESEGFFERLIQPPSPEGVIPTVSLTLEGGSHVIDVAPYFSSENTLEYEARSTPSGIVTGRISGSVITIIPESPDSTTIVVTARDTVTGLTAIQTIPVFVRQSQVTITRPTNTDPPYTPTTTSNPRAEGLREGVSVIVDGLASGNNLRVREGAGTNYETLGLVTNGDYGIITDGPRFSGDHTWWEIDWDTERLDGWSAEVVGGVQLLFRRPPDLEIRDLDVSDSEVSPGERIDLEIEIRNNGPGESAATDVYIYYSENRHSDLEELRDDSDLRGGWKLSVPSIRERRTETLTYRVDAPTELDSYYYGALLPNNIHPSDNTDHLDEDSIRNNLAREERVQVVGSPDYIVESISLSRNNTIFDPGDSFRLEATVRNIGTAEPRYSATLNYYRSNDARISTSDRWVDEDSVIKLEPEETRTRSASLTAPSEPGVYYYGACISDVRNESDRSNNCSGSIAITVRNVPTPVEVSGSPDLIVTLSSNSNLVDPNEYINLTANIRNQGDADASNSTTLRYYLSTDATVSSDDQLLATDSVRILTEGSSDNEDHGVRAPTQPGRYYYYACVDSITDEEDTTNNCSNFILINVRGSDLVVESPSVDLLGQTGGIDPNGEFVLNATIRNQGTGNAASTTVRYYISADQTFSTTNDSEVQTDNISSINAGALTTVQSSRIRAPWTSGIFYCFICVDSLSNETDTSNNCSEPIQITIRNVSPLAQGRIPNQTLNVGTTKSLEVANYFTDANNDTLNYTANSSDVNIATATASGSQVIITPKKAGSATITVTASDGSLSATQTFSVSVTVPNRAPTAVGTIAAQTLTIGEAAKVVNVSANFSDPDNDTLRFTAASNKGHIATATASGSQITITPVSEGNATITVTASDGKLSATQRISVSVVKANRAPLAVGTIAAQTLTIGEVPKVINVSANFSDPDNDTLRFTAASNKRHIATATASGSQITITPVSEGNATITVTASDGKLSATQTFSVSVVKANRAPLAVGTISARTLTVGDPAIQIDVASNFSDPDGDTLNYTVNSNNDSVATTTVSRSIVSISPVAAGSATITVTASDGEFSATQTVSVTVTAAPIPNRAPITVGAISSQTMTVGDAAITIDVASNFRDPDGDSLEFTANSNNNSVATASASGSIVTITPTAAGSTTITVTASDGELTATQNFLVTVTAAPVSNRAPFTVGAISARTLTVGDSPIVINVLANFNDPDEDTLTYTVSSNDDNVATASNAGSQITITPIGVGTATITVTANDGEFTASQTISVTVTAAPIPNRAPFTVGAIPSQTFTVGDSATTVNVSSNFGDPDDDTLTYTASSNNNNVATTSASGSIVTITPVAAGSATITVTASDRSLSVNQTISVTVNAANRAPTAVGSIPAQTLTVGDSATTVNVSSYFSDLDNDTLIYSANTNNSNVATASASGAIVTITPVAAGSATITVTASDRSLSVNQTISVTVQTASLTITPVNVRTQQVQDAIVEVIAGVNSADDVTATHLAVITELNLRHKSISSLSSGDFDGLTALTSLELSANDLTSLPSGIFDELTALTSLELTDNDLTSLPSGILDELTALTRLNLAINALTSLPADIFDELTALTWLNLYGNALTSLPAGIFDELTALSILSLVRNALTSLPAGIFDELTALTGLGLTNNDLTSLPSGIFDELTALTTLSLPHNHLTSLPSGIFDELTALTSLNLASIALTSLPSGIFDELTALTRLFLGGNQIRDFSACENLTTLTYLDVSRNPITDYAPLNSLKTANPNVSITINLDNNIPVFTEGASTTRSVTENTAAGVNIGTAVSATDKDNDTLTYSLSGTDAESFGIVSSSGQLQTSAALDYETKTSYSVTIRAYDGNSAADFIDVTINVTDDPNAAPSAQANPQQTSLLPNYPNPFNPETWIPYQLSEPADVALTIYNARGSVVRKLALGHQAPGVYYSRNRAAHWDGKNNLGEKVSGGVYFVKFKAGNYTKIRKMLIRK